jgi:hypothetical protein
MSPKYLGEYPIRNKKIHAILFIFFFLSIILSGCFSTPENSNYVLHGNLWYDQYLNEDNILNAFETNNISVGEIEKEYDEWTTEEFSKEIECVENWTYINFDYYIIVDLTKYTIPKGSFYSSNNNTLEVRIIGTVANFYYDDGYQTPDDDHYISLSISQLGYERDEVIKWKPIIKAQLDYMEQIINNATGLTSIEEEIYLIK